MEEIRLLYVDDSRTAQRLMLNVVEPIADFISALTVNDARQMIQEDDSITFFILDYELPDGDGLQLAREIRRRPRHRHTPIILYAASMDNEMAYRAMLTGVNDSLKKPMNKLELRQHIARLIETPTIRQVRRELVQLTCFSWVAGDRYHEYSPDLNHHIEGDCPEAVRKEMQAILEERIMARHDKSEYPADVHVFKHVVSLIAEPERNNGDGFYVHSI